MEVTVRGLWKSYGGAVVLQDVSLTAPVGVTCLMAPSGGGKTTLLRILLGLETPDRGDIALPGRAAAVFQEDRLLEGRSALENLRLVLGPALERPRAEALLAELGLGDVGDKAVRSFSGGMRRRLALARALLAPAAVLLLDEPFTGLDAENRDVARQCLARWASGKIVLLATHDPGDAAALAAAVVEL